LVGVGEGAPDEHTSAVPLLEPRDGIPPVTATAGDLSRVAARFAAASGPVALDAERASGYRYGQRAYLVQLRRAGAGTALVDPVGCPDLTTLGEALAGAEWVLHAANQDLPCLREIGMMPRRLFDTELAGRLAGFERVGLGALVERLLGFTLEKGHAAVDWSKRPLPEPWLRYAALDVELLVDLRDALAEELLRQGKFDWALEEFEALVVAPPAPARPDPWRRTSGIHRVRNRRQLAAIRSLWEARDQVARERDVAPGRIVPDSALVAAAIGGPSSATELMEIDGYTGRGARRYAGTFAAALHAAARLPESALPRPVPVGDGPPPTNRWADRDPVAAARLSKARAALAAIADDHNLPVENLLSPELVRRLAWTPPAPATESAVAAALTEGGARAWQVRLTTRVLVDALAVDESRASTTPAAIPSGDPCCEG
jgi:ribonuclease D